MDIDDCDCTVVSAPDVRVVDAPVFKVNDFSAFKPMLAPAVAIISALSDLSVIKPTELMAVFAPLMNFISPPDAVTRTSEPVECNDISAPASACKLDPAVNLVSPPLVDVMVVPASRVVLEPLLAVN